MVNIKMVKMVNIKKIVQFVNEKKYVQKCLNFMKKSCLVILD
jgi:hypothetical protein